MLLIGRLNVINKENKDACFWILTFELGLVCGSLAIKCSINDAFDTFPNLTLKSVRVLP